MDTNQEAAIDIGNVNNTNNIPINSTVSNIHNNEDLSKLNAFSFSFDTSATIFDSTFQFDLLSKIIPNFFGTKDNATEMPLFVFQANPEAPPAVTRAFSCDLETNRVSAASTQQTEEKTDNGNKSTSNNNITN